MTEFNAFVCSAGLLDVGFSAGVGMTWSNNRTGSANIKARLDRFFYQYSLLVSFASVNC